MKAIDMSARTAAEAVELALKSLGCSRDDVTIQVLVREDPERDIEALVRVEVVDENEEQRVEIDEQPPLTDEERAQVGPLARRTLEEMLKHMGIEAYVSDVTTRGIGRQGEEQETVTLHVEGTDEQNTSLLIGRRGDTLHSLQFLLNLLVSRRVRYWPQLVVDVGNYRQRRRESLESLAYRIADKVKQTNQSVTLEPMPPFERRIIHMALYSIAGVYTESEGEGEHRKIIIFPKKD